MKKRLITRNNPDWPEGLSGVQRVFSIMTRAEDGDDGDGVDSIIIYSGNEHAVRSPLVLPSRALNFENFERNPVVLWGHDGSNIPIGRSTELTREGDDGRVIRSKFEWLAGDPFAERVRNAWQAGFVRAASIGFWPNVIRWIDEGETDDDGVPYDTETKWFIAVDADLLEWSIVPVPADPDALRVIGELSRAAKLVATHDSASHTLKIRTNIPTSPPVDGDILGESTRRYIEACIRAALVDMRDEDAMHAAIQSTKDVISGLKRTLKGGTE